MVVWYFWHLYCSFQFFHNIILQKEFLSINVNDWYFCQRRNVLIIFDWKFTMAINNTKIPTGSKFHIKVDINSAFMEWMLIIGGKCLFECIVENGRFSTWLCGLSNTKWTDTKALTSSVINEIIISELAFTLVLCIPGIISQRDRIVSSI